MTRPKTRAECIDGPRPCPFVSCRHHLYLEVAEKTGVIKLNFPGLEVDELAESCALDVADYGGATRDEIGAVLGVTKGRVMQIENRALAKVKRRRLHE